MTRIAFPTTNLGSVTTAPVTDLRYLAPDATGVGFNDKPYLTLDGAISNLNRTGAIWAVGPNGQITYTFLDKDPTGLYNSPKYANLSATILPASRRLPPSSVLQRGRQSSCGTT